MNKRVCFLSLVLICMLNKFSYVQAQGESMEQITVFGSRIKNAIELDVRTDEHNIFFNVSNNSYFPYDFEVKFNDFRNLSPRVFEKKTTLFPGVNRLFTFKIIDPQVSPVLSYQTKYYLAKTNTGDEKFNPYLIPVGKNRTVAFLTTENDGMRKIFINQFVMNPGDTVFNSRKGIVTALQDNMTEVDRIVGVNSLEIRHDDGTIGVYIGLNPEIKFVKLGKPVYPGQPLGLIGTSKLLTFQIFEVLDMGSVKSFDFLYSGPDAQMSSAQNISGMKVTYPDAVIKKELTKKEISRLEKNILY
jgi:hypothetical protein